MNEIERLRKANERVLSRVDDQFSELLHTAEDLELQCSDYDMQVFVLNEELSRQKDELELLRSELRFLGSYLSESGTSFPLSGHSIDFGEFLPRTDPRRNAIEWEE